jgi:hypothetical protein
MMEGVGVSVVVQAGEGGEGGRGVQRRPNIAAG